MARRPDSRLWESRGMMAVQQELRSVPGPAWLVGGAVRDLLLERPVLDLDVVVAGEPRIAADRYARSTGGHPFRLSDRFGTWRVVRDPADGGDPAVREVTQVDFTRLRGDALEADLAGRDLTVNAIASPLEGLPELIDPLGGLDDLQAGVVRLVSRQALLDDPLRLLRVARTAHVLGFAVEPGTAAHTAQLAHRLLDAAAERRYAELRFLLTVGDPAEGMRLLDRLGLIEYALPELAALRGIAPGPGRRLAPYDGALAAASLGRHLADEPADVLDDAGPAVARLLAEALGDGLSVGDGLVLGALASQFGEAERRTAPRPPATAGAARANHLCAFLHTSERVRALTVACATHHGRLAEAVVESGGRPLDGRARHRFVVATAPHAVAVALCGLVATAADRGGLDAAGAERAAAIQLVHHAVTEAVAPTIPVIDGRALMRRLGLRPGPVVGRLLAALAEEQAAGTVRDAEQAVAFARERLAAEDPAVSSRR